MKILIIDDNDDVIKSLKMQLKEHELTVFKNCPVTKTITDGKYDLLIIDVKLKNQNGLEEAKKIRVVNPNQKIIMITGYVSLFEYELEQYDGYYDRLLVKPITKELLTINIKEVMSGSD